MIFGIQVGSKSCNHVYFPFITTIAAASDERTRKHAPLILIIDGDDAKTRNYN